MEKPDSASGSGGSTVYNTLFIDTSLDTHLAMIVSDSDTVSDLKKKILYEHPLCFPNIGEIKINALKVKRKGYLYHLSDSMFVKSAFDGVSKSWFLSADASSAEERSENCKSHKPDSGVVACFGITTNNSSADVVNLVPYGPSKRLSNINDSSLPQDGNNHHAKQNSASQQFGFGNSAKENAEDLHMEVEHTADSNCKDLFPATNKGSRPKVQEKDVGDNIICEDLPASVSAPVLKENQTFNERKKDAFHDHAVEEYGASVVESGEDALADKINERGVGLNDMKLGNQILVDETCKTVSSDRNKRSATRKRMADEGTEVPVEHSECEPSKHKDVSLSKQEYKLTENSSQSGPASKKKHKPERKDRNGNSLIENGVLISELVKQGTGPDLTISEDSLGQKLGSASAVSGHLNTEAVKGSGRKKRKRQKSNPSQVGSEISSVKDVIVDTFQAIEAINHNDLGSEADPVVLGPISEPCLISSKEMQKVSKTDRVAHTGGDDDMAHIGEGNIESKNEALEPDVALAVKTRDSVDQNASHVDGHPTLVSQEGINLQNDIGVLGQGNQSVMLEDKIVEPKKPSKKIKKSKKTKVPVGGTEALDAGHDRGPASDIVSSERPTSVTADHLSDNAEQDGTTDGKEGSKMKTAECLPSVTDVGADDVIRDVLESLQQCNNGLANAENMEKKSRKRTKKKSCTVVDTPELQGKDDIDHRDPTVVLSCTHQNASHVDGHPTLVSQEGINLQNDIGVSGQENQSVMLEDKIVEPKKPSKKIKKSKKTKVPVGGTEALDAGHDRGPASEAPDPSVASVTKTRDSIDQNACHVNGHPAVVSQEGINLQNRIGVSVQENQSVTLEDKIVEPKKSSRKIKKPKKTKDPVGGTEALDAGHDRVPASDIVSSERPTSVTADHLSDNAEQDGTTEGKEASKMKTAECLPSVTDVGADDVIRDVLESLQQCNNGPANAENMEKKSRKRTKKKSCTLVDTPELQGKDDIDHWDQTVLSDNVSEVSASSKSARKTKVANSSSAAHLNGSDLGSKNNTGVGISPVHAQLDSSQITLKANQEGRPVVNGDQPKSTSVLDANNSVEVPCESERIKSQHQHEIVGSGEILVDTVTDKKGVVTEVKGKRKKKKKPDAQSGGSTTDFPSSQILNGNQHKNAKAQAAKSSSIQSQRSSSKVEAYSSNVQSSTTPLTIFESAGKEHLQSNKSEKINSIPKQAQRPIDINSSRALTRLEKNNAHAASSSTSERSKNTIALNKGGNEGRSHLDISKATGSNNGKVLNSLENKKSLLGTAGTIFKHDDKESSDDEDGVDNSDDSTRTPSDNSSSSDDSDMDISASQNGSYDSEGEESGRRNREKPGSSSPKRMHLHEILRNSSRYKKAKLTASQSQLDDLDSQPDEFVPDSQAK